MSQSVCGFILRARGDIGRVLPENIAPRLVPRHNVLPTIGPGRVRVADVRGRLPNVLRVVPAHVAGGCHAVVGLLASSLTSRNVAMRPPLILLLPQVCGGEHVLLGSFYLIAGELARV